MRVSLELEIRTARRRSAVCTIALKIRLSRTEQPVARKVPSLITRRFTHAVDLCATAIAAALVVTVAASSRSR